MSTRHLGALILLPIVAGCAGAPRVLVAPSDDGRAVYVWRFKGDEVVGATSYVLEGPSTEHPTRSVILADSAKVEKVKPPR